MPDEWTKNSAARRRLSAMVRRRREPCRICGEDIDYSLPAGNPRSFSVEHIKPRHLYPELTFDLANLAAAHLECNKRDQGKGKSKWIKITEQVNSRDW